MRSRALFLVVLALAPACAWSAPPLAVGSGQAPESTRIIAADGTLITLLHGEENREEVALRRMPKVLQQAVVAIEDERFWDHRGVDLKAVARAAYENAASGRVVEGGSTITQQYVKNEVLTTKERNVRRKVQEAARAYELEQRYSKSRILELYLNSIYFGNGAYGVAAAAQEYFGVPVERLSLPQAALLAGLIHAPRATDPFDHPDVAMRRRRQVLEKMASLALVTPEEAEAAASESLGLRDPTVDDRYAAPHFVERVKRFILNDPRFGATRRERLNLLFAGGLRITTTIDLRQQALAEQAVARVLSEPDRDPEAAVTAIEPSTGHVKALVGGRHFFDGGAQGKLDLASQGLRPAGSSFKPFVLAAALQQGVPLSRTYDAPGHLTIPLSGKRPPWEVENYEGQGGGRLDLVEGTVSSVNTLYAQLILDVGPANAVNLASRMGVTTPLNAYESAVLGTNDVHPFDMAAAYATFANRGVFVPPVLVTKVVGRNGVILFSEKHTEKRVLETPVVDTAVDVLQQVVERGTGVAAKIGRPAAGKTGTGQRWRDAWFVGFTPQLSTSVWVGFPERQRSMVPPETRTLVTGGSWPAKIWQLFMSQALADVPVKTFPVPPATPTEIAAAPDRPVTKVVGMPVAQAEAALTRNGFRVRRREVANTEYPPGYVIRQSPTPNTMAPGGAMVTLEVSRGGVSTTEVPDVLGLNGGEARRRLAEAGFNIDAVVEREPPGVGAGDRKGKVWKQSPSSGGRAANGSTVTVWVNPV